MKKISKILTPAIGATIIASVAPFAAASCFNTNKGKDNKPISTIKLTNDIAPINVDMQNACTPLTIRNNTDKFFGLQLNRIPTGTTIFGRWGSNNSWIENWQVQKIVYLYPGSTTQIVLAWDKDETGQFYGDIGSFSTKEEKIHINFLALSEIEETDQPLEIGGSLLSMFCVKEYGAEKPSMQCAVDMKGDYCFSELFVPSEDAGSDIVINTTMKFRVSTNLLPFKNLTAHCYDSMFKGCKGLLNTPALPSERLQEGCYENMFYGCETLELSGNIPSAIVATDCYKNMFYNCHNLKLISLGYVGNITNRFFQDWLKNAGTNVASGIIRYNGLDTKETTTDLVPNNYTFIKDQSLIDNHTKTLTLEGDKTTSQVTDTKPTFRYYSDQGLTWADIKNQLPEYSPITAGNAFKSWYKQDLSTALTIADDTPVSELPDTLVPVYGIEEEDPKILPRHASFVVEEACTVRVYEIGNNLDSRPLTETSNIKYLKKPADGDWPDYTVEENWHQFTPGTWENPPEAVPFEAGCSIALKGNSQTLNPLDAYTRITISGGKVRLGGDVMSLALKADGTLPDPTVIPSKACFASLFKNSDAIVSVDPKFLPATELKDWCYASMFNNCTNLTIAPELPAKTAAGACYHWMFANCAKLETVPVLDLETLVDPVVPLKYDGASNKTYNGVCDHMFNNCPKLVNVPDLKPKYVNDRAYSFMFCGCDSLVKTPKILAEEFADAKYYGWYGWESTEYGGSVLTGPCYRMFAECDSLVDASEMFENAPKNGKGCFGEMFSSCKALRKLPILSSELKEYCYYQMFYNDSNLSGLTTIPLYVLNDEAASGTSYKFFECPSTIPEKAVTNMFRYTTGYSTEDSSKYDRTQRKWITTYGNYGTPVAGETYYYVI